MKVCFYARAGQLEFYVGIASRFVERGVDCCFVTQHPAETRFVKKRFPAAQVYEIEKFLRSKWDGAPSDWNSLAAKYDSASMWRILYTDRFLINYSKDDAVKMARLHFEFFEMVFETEHPSFFVNEAVAILAAFVALEVGRHHGVDYLGTMIARESARTKFFLVRDIFQRNFVLDELYPTFRAPDSELQEASRYLTDFRLLQARPAYMEVHKRVPRFRVKMVGQLVKYWGSRRAIRYRDVVSYMSYGRSREIISPLQNYLNYRKSRRFYSAPVSGEDFFLFPLHYQPEASTLVCAPKYEKQLIAIDHLAKTLPADSVLYVKEHYAALGHRNIQFYRELACYPNVRLIDPMVDVHGLIKASRAVVVLTSTTGFEAILHGKKVFVLGNVFYDRFENVVRLDDVFSSGEELGDCEPLVGDDEIINFLAAYRRSLLPGCVASAFPEYLAEDNLDATANSFLAYVEKAAPREFGR